MKFLVSLDEIDPFWLMCAARYLFITPECVFGPDYRKDLSCVRLLKNFYAVYCANGFLPSDCAKVFSMTFSRIEIDMRTQEIIPREILVMSDRTIFYEKYKGRIYYHSIDCKTVLHKLKQYSRLSGPELYCFWVTSLSAYMNRPACSVTEANIHSVSKLIDRGIEVYSFTEGALTFEFASYLEKIETPLRIIKPDTKSIAEPCLVIYNDLIVETAIQKVNIVKLYLTEN